MDATAALLRGRRAAQALMVDSCRIDRPGEPVLDPATGASITPTALVYVGSCRVQVTDFTEARPEAGQRAWTVTRATISVPITVLGVRVGDVVTVTTSSLDPDLTGRSWRVAASVDKTHATARRLLCEEVPA